MSESVIRGAAVAEGPSAPVGAEPEDLHGAVHRRRPAGDPRWMPSAHELEPGVVGVRISAPEQPHLSVESCEALVEVLRQVAARPHCQSVILYGEGRYFSAGASEELLLETCGTDALSDVILRGVRALSSIPVPTISAMQGHAIGGGLLLGLWCDIPLLARESLYGANFMRYGLTPGMGSTLLLERYFGAPLSRELMYTGSLVTGLEIQRGGVPLSRYVAPRAEVMPRARTLARSIGEVPRRALVALKSALERQQRASVAAALEGEGRLQRSLLGRRDMRREFTHRVREEC